MFDCAAQASGKQKPHFKTFFLKSSRNASVASLPADDGGIGAFLPGGAFPTIHSGYKKLAVRPKWVKQRLNDRFTFAADGIE